MALKLTDIDDYFDKEEEVEEVKQPDHQNEVKKSDNDDIDDDVFITPASIKRKRRKKLIVLGTILLIALFFVARNMFWGTEAEYGKVRCYVVSLEKRGTVFESYEGLLIEEGTLVERGFSTRNPELGKRIYNALGSDSLFVLEYTKYHTALPWRGETTFVVSNAETSPAYPLEKPKLKNKKK